MSCKEEIVLGVEEGLFLLPLNLFNEIFLDHIVPFPQSYRGGTYYDRKPRTWNVLNHYSSMEKPGDVGAEQKPRGTGVFLPQRPVNSTQEKIPKKKPCTIISSHSKQIFLPKEWAY